MSTTSWSGGGWLGLLISCNALFAPGPIGTSGPLGTLQYGGIMFLAGLPDCANSDYSTVIAHECGHFVAWNLMGINDSEGGAFFHEGFGDTLALLVYGAEIQAEDFFGCEDHGRWPRKDGIEHTFPMCAGTVTCSTSHSSGAHCLAELLPAIWLDLRDGLGGGTTRDLFLDWMMIAMKPTEDRCTGGTGGDQAVDRGTLVEVLEAAGNTSPHIATICEAFFERGIEHPDPTPNPCADSSGWFCYADCDGSTVLDYFDFLCFQNAFAAGDSYADCDGDAQAAFFDLLCFQNVFIAGCP